MPVIQKNGPQTFTTGDTRSNHTGSWRYMKPVFANRNPPCREACPIGNPIARFINLVAIGNEKAALTVLKEENPLPGVCGRVCPHPCIPACNRGAFDDALLVNEVERFLGDQSKELGLCLPEPAAQSGKTVAVIGSGPAGLSMAYHSSLLGHAVTIYEKEAEPGGLLRYGIPTYRLPRDVLDRDLQFIEQLDVTLVTNAAIDKEQYKNLVNDFDAVGIAIGAQNSYRLAIEGEQPADVIAGLDFLRALHLGSPKKTGKRAVVIGGGNTAMDAARCARRLGAEVQILYRRSQSDMPAIAAEIEDAMEEGVQFKFFAAPIGIEQNNGRLSSIRCIEMKPGKPDNSGRRRPEPIAGSEFTVDADTVITAVGESVAFPFFDRVEKAGEAPLEIDDWGGTSQDNIFVCGDAGPNPRTVAHAIGSGKHTAIKLDAFWQRKELNVPRGSTISMARYRSEIKESLTSVQPEHINLDYFTKSAPPEIKKTEVPDRLNGFDEIHTAIGADAVSEEAGRCFSCGYCNKCGTCFMFCPDMSIVIPNQEPLPKFIGDYCKGCGICARECPSAVIQMVEEQK
ncbi:MAG: FAD-dependent oxidoreductase [Proteobacteria bacterium]|nr:FAD-dependent oxidoreductase [Pseudomonadota bacterium]